MSEAARSHRKGEDKDTFHRQARSEDDLTNQELAAYILDALVSFRQMAESRDLKFLTYLIDMSAQEASNICDLQRADKK